jgi:hypothetical protein
MYAELKYFFMDDIKHLNLTRFFFKRKQNLCFQQRIQFFLFGIGTIHKQIIKQYSKNIYIISLKNVVSKSSSTDEFCMPLVNSNMDFFGFTILIENYRTGLRIRL